jgi:hypothetical protein
MTKVCAGHTPGPWEAHDDDGTGTLPCVLSDKVNAGGNFYVAQCNVFEDARLIASAPDLLDACKAIAALAGGQGQRNMMEVAGQAKAAIAKAMGRD